MGGNEWVGCTNRRCTTEVVSSCLRSSDGYLPSRFPRTFSLLFLPISHVTSRLFFPYDLKTNRYPIDYSVVHNLFCWYLLAELRARRRKSKWECILCYWFCYRPLHFSVSTRLELYRVQSLNRIKPTIHTNISLQDGE